MFSDVTPDFILRDALPRRYNNGESDNFAPFLGRYANCSRIGDGGVLVKQVFNLSG